MNNELQKLKLTLERVINNKNNSVKTRSLAKGALNAIKQIQEKLNSDDPQLREEATTDLIRVLRPTRVSQTA